MGATLTTLREGAELIRCGFESGSCPTVVTVVVRVLAWLDLPRRYVES